MAATARHPGRRGRQETEQLLDPFLEALATRRLLSIPQDTVLGAITHFLSTLPTLDLPHLIDAILTSEALWSAEYLQIGQLSHAISLAVRAKVGNARKDHEKSWLASRRISAKSKRWLHDVRTAVEDVGKGEVRNLEAKRHILEARAGLLAGTEACKEVDWQAERMNLEEDIVLAVADLDLKKLDTASLAILCQVVNHLDPARLAVLDLQTILQVLQVKLLAELETKSTRALPPSRLATALARTYTVYSMIHRHEYKHLLESMEAFVTAMRQRAESDEVRLGRKGASKLSDQEWNRHKTVLFAFLTPASSIIDIMIERQQTNLSNDCADHTRLVIGIIETLAAFSYITEQTEGGLEGHDRVLHGSLDIVEATSGAEGVSRLFRSLVTPDAFSDRIAFVLRTAEQVIGTIDGKTISTCLLPICEQYLARSEESKALEAAHAFMLALIAQAGKSDERPLSQYAFVMEIVPHYSQLLLEQFAQSKISADQLRSSYTTITEVASKTDDRLAQECIDRLDRTASQKPDERQTLLLVRISLAPFVPIRHLRQYLDSLAVDIVGTPPGEGRLELAAKAFGMVVHDLGDDRKQTGMEWWLRWKREIEGTDKRPSMRAKL